VRRSGRSRRGCLIGVGLLVVAVGVWVWIRGGGVATSRVTGVEILRENGGRVDWSEANGLIAFDMVGEDGFYDIYTIEPDGTNERCLTCGKGALLPQRHNGNPAWHPSGEFLVFQAEREEHPLVSSRPTLRANPGIGQYNDLWIVSREGERVYRLTDAEDAALAALHPHFSPDGTRLSWSEMVEEPTYTSRRRFFGLWRLKVAEFSLGAAGPELRNVRTYQPGGAAFYENHGFSPEGGDLLFTSNFESAARWFIGNDIFLMELETGATRPLTDEGYNEHAGYLPDGRIVWMSNVDNRNRGTDYWMMNADGSEKVRLTCFNNRRCAEHDAWRIVAADWTPSPDGRSIAALLLTRQVWQRGNVALIEWELP
jgi:Tol biopolymer transport system component